MSASTHLDSHAMVFGPIALGVAGLLFGFLSISLLTAFWSKAVGTHKRVPECI